MADENVVNAEVGGVAADRLRSLIERIERLEEEKKMTALNPAVGAASRLSDGLPDPTRLPIRAFSTISAIFLPKLKVPVLMLRPCAPS